MAFGGADIPQVQPVVAPPDPNSSDPATRLATQRAMDAAAKEQRSSRGRSSTILNKNLDLNASDKAVAKNTLLGS
jgi:hypothetical protein